MVSFFRSVTNSNKVDQLVINPEMDVIADRKFDIIGDLRRKALMQLPSSMTKLDLSSMLELYKLLCIAAR